MLRDKEEMSGVGEVVMMEAEAFKTSREQEKKKEKKKKCRGKRRKRIRRC